jgi:eukaryotic-like serine/threonine-protein kinase
MRNSRPERRVGTRIADRYRLDRLVANGGMAQVWEATDETLRRRVAIKILHDHLADASTVARFRAEGVTAARLTHPGVVAIFDTCAHDGLDAIVMEFVDGPTLRDVLDRDGPLPVGRAVGIAVEIADALTAAHRLGLVHRDVKPANVLVCPDGSIKVTDFGIAKVRDEAGADLTLPGTFLGTAKYLSPEQVEGRPVDARSDVYSLGVLLYEMLSGQVPFAGSTDAAIALARLQRPPRPLREIAPAVPPAVASVVHRAMAREPSERHAGMVELRLALEDAQRGTGPVAPVPVVDATSVHTTAPAPAPRFADTERRWLVPAVFVSVVAVSLTIAAILIGQSDAGQQLVDRAKKAVGAGNASTSVPESAEGTPIAALGSSAFDPEGDGHEHDDDVRAVIDGDPATVWTTEGYNSRTFGIKRGVGLYVDIGDVAELGQLEVTSPTNAWSATVHVAPAVGGSLEDWGPAVATRSGIASGDSSFDLEGAEGRYVLLWIVDLGDSTPARTTLAEVTVIAA